MNDKYHIASDGTIFEVQQDGGIKKLGRIKNDGDVEPYKDESNSSKELRIKNPTKKEDSSKKELKAPFLFYITILLIAISGFFGLVVCSKTDGIYMDYVADRTDYYYLRLEELSQFSWISIIPSILTALCVGILKCKSSHNYLLASSVLFAIICIINLNNPPSTMWLTNIVYIVFVASACIFQLSFTKKKIKGYILNDISSTIKIITILEMIWVIGMWLFCLQNFGIIPK